MAVYSEEGSSPDFVIVAALDIGTTYSGYAFSFVTEYKQDPDKIFLKPWRANSGFHSLEKTPTCILYDKNGEFHSFGFEAEELFVNICSGSGSDDEGIQSASSEIPSKNADGWMFFSEFKMVLYETEDIDFNFMLTSTNGQQMPAIQVFSDSIKYLTEALLEECNKQTTGIDMEYIVWILTVPAIWSDKAKLFMREAAEKAGVCRSRLRLVLEPEAAAIYMRHVNYVEDRDEQGTTSMETTSMAAKQKSICSSSNNKKSKTLPTTKPENIAFRRTEDREAAKQKPTCSSSNNKKSNALPQTKPWNVAFKGTDERQAAKQKPTCSSSNNKKSNALPPTKPWNVAFKGTDERQAAKQKPTCSSSNNKKSNALPPTKPWNVAFKGTDERQAAKQKPTCSSSNNKKSNALPPTKPSIVAFKGTEERQAAKQKPICSSSNNKKSNALPPTKPSIVAFKGTEERQAAKQKPICSSSNNKKSNALPPTKPWNVAFKGTDERQAAKEMPVSSSSNNKTLPPSKPENIAFRHFEDREELPTKSLKAKSIVASIVKPKRIHNIQPGSTYLLIDAGGGTIDVVLHTITNNHKIKEISKASGGHFGGTMVDQMFLDNFLPLAMTKSVAVEDKEKAIRIGRQVMRRFRFLYPDDYLELKRSFESKKRSFRKDITAEWIRIHIPCTLEKTFTETYPDVKYDLKVKNSKLKIYREVMASFFNDPIEKIKDHLRKLTSDPRFQWDQLSTVIMVGGFSESEMLVSALKEFFSGKKAIVPKDPSLAVLKGAVIFGQSGDVFAERISKYTYGIKCEGPYDEKVHPQKFRFVDNKGVAWCHNLVDIHVRIGDTLHVGEPQSVRAYSPSLFVKDGNFRFGLYYTLDKEPLFVTKMTKIGDITFSIPDEELDLDEDIFISLTFSEPEIVIKGSYKDIAITKNIKFSLDTR